MDEMSEQGMIDRLEALGISPLCACDSGWALGLFQAMIASGSVWDGSIVRSNREGVPATWRVDFRIYYSSGDTPSPLPNAIACAFLRAVDSGREIPAVIEPDYAACEAVYGLLRKTDARKWEARISFKTPLPDVEPWMVGVGKPPWNISYVRGDALGAVIEAAYAEAVKQMGRTRPAWFIG